MPVEVLENQCLENAGKAAFLLFFISLCWYLDGMGKTRMGARTKTQKNVKAGKKGKKKLKLDSLLCS